MIIANPLPAARRFFHTFDDEGAIRYQGRFIEQVEPAAWRVLLYSAIDGEPNGEIILDLTKVDGLAVYYTAQRMNEALAIASIHDWENPAALEAYEYL